MGKDLQKQATDTLTQIRQDLRMLKESDQAGSGNDNSAVDSVCRLVESMLVEAKKLAKVADEVEREPEEVLQLSNMRIHT